MRRAGATGEIVLRADSGFWNAKLFAWLRCEGIAYSIGVRLQAHVRAAIEAIDPDGVVWAICAWPLSSKLSTATTRSSRLKVLAAAYVAHLGRRSLSSPAATSHRSRHTAVEQGLCASGVCASGLS